LSFPFFRFVKRIFKKVKEFIFPPPPPEKMYRAYVGLDYAVNGKYHVLMGFKFVKFEEEIDKAIDELYELLKERYKEKVGYSIEEMRLARAKVDFYWGSDEVDYDENLIGEIEFEEPE